LAKHYSGVVNMSKSSEVKVIMPKLGMTMQSGTIVKWVKKEGDKVVKDEVIAEIETEKLTGEVKAPATGVLIKILRKEGDEVPVGEPIAIIRVEGNE